MPKRHSKKQILIACQMSFDGKSNSEIAGELGATETTVSKWRKTETWAEFELQLVDAYKQHVIETEFVTPLAD